MNVICVYIGRGESVLVAVLEWPDGVDSQQVIRHYRGSLGLPPDPPMQHTAAPVIAWNDLKNVFRPYRQTLDEAEYTLVRRVNDDEVILRSDTGQDELWVKNPDVASYAILIDGIAHEFVSSVTAAEMMGL